MDSLVKARLASAKGAPFAGSAQRQPAGKTADAHGGVADRVRRQLIQRLDPKLLRDSGDARAQEQIRSLINQILDAEAEGLTRLQRTALAQEVVNDMLGYGPVQDLLDDPDVTEVMINRWDDVWFEKNGRLQRSEIRFRDDEHVRTVIQKIVGPLGRRVDESSPMVDARLPDGSRVNAVIPPLAVDGACVTVRKFGKKLNPEDLVALGTLSPEVLGFLEACVKGRLNILVSGGTGSGKTTLLNVLSSFIPEGERIVTIEDSAELALQQPHVVRLEARPPNMEGKGEVSIRALVRNALRMRPDRIIVGEVRGGEALDMLQAMNTGHEGSLTTLHANGARDALSRLETMVLMAGEDLPLKAVREQVTSALDMVVQIARLRDGTRRIVSIAEVRDCDRDGNPEVVDLWTFNETGLAPDERIEGSLVTTGQKPQFLGKLRWRGVRVDEAFLRDGEPG